MSAARWISMDIGAARCAADLDQPFGVRGVRRADHQEGVDLRGDGLDGGLPVGGGIADVFVGGGVDQREAGLQGGDDLGGVVDGKGGLGDEGEPGRVADLQAWPRRRRFRPAAPRPAEAGPWCRRSRGGRRGRSRSSAVPASWWRAASLWTLVTRGQVASTAIIWRGGGLGGDGFRDAVGGEDDGAVVGAVVQLLDEDRALARRASTTNLLWTISWRT